MMIDLGRDSVRYAEAGHRERAAGTLRMGRELHGSTLGVIGLGRIGRHLADLALAFGMRVLASDPQRDRRPRRRIARRSPLPELLAGSDFVVCLAPAQRRDREAARRRRVRGDEARRLLRQRGARRAGRRRRPPRRARRRAPRRLRRSTSAAPPTRCRRRRSLRHPRVLATPHMGGLTLPAIEHQAMETVAQLASPAERRAAGRRGQCGARDAGERNSRHEQPPPPGACDCHMHVSRTASRSPRPPPSRRRTPPPTPTARCSGARPEPRRRRPADRLCLRQPLHPARRLPERRAIVVVAPGTSEAELAGSTPRRARRPLHDAARRRARLESLEATARGSTPSAGTSTCSSTAATCRRAKRCCSGSPAGWRSTTSASSSARRPRERAFASLCRLDARRCWIKLSAPYESSKSGPPDYADIAPLARRLAERYPERCLWASNWPHPNDQPLPSEQALLEWTDRCIGNAAPAEDPGRQPPLAVPLLSAGRPRHRTT